MSLCDFCNKEVKYTFICPKCGNHFCKEHRKQEDHDCKKNIQTPLEYPVEEKNSPSSVLDSYNSDHIPETNVEYRNLEEVLFTEKNSLTPKSYGSSMRSYVAQLDTKLLYAILITVTLISGALIGVLIYPNEDTDNLQQRYDTLSEYYLSLIHI